MSALAKNTENTSKIAKKQPNVNLKNTKCCTKISAAGGSDCTITLQGASRPLPLVSCGTAYVLQFVNDKTFKYFIIV